MAVMSEELFKAIRQGDTDRVEKLLNKSRSLANAKDSSSMTAVMLATYYGQPKIAKILISYGARLDLFEAAMTGELRVVKEIVENDPAVVNSFAKDGFTPLHLASFFGHVEVAKYLIERGAVVDAVANNTQKVTPLHSAAARSQVEISDLLLKSGANPNAKQEMGFTPLHAAAQSGSIELARLLLKHGADANTKTEDGRRPLDMTKEEGREAGPKDKRDAVAIFLVENG